MLPDVTYLASTCAWARPRCQGKVTHGVNTAKSQSAKRREQIMFVLKIVFCHRSISLHPSKYLCVYTCIYICVSLSLGSLCIFEYMCLSLSL